MTSGAILRIDEADDAALMVAVSDAMSDEEAEREERNVASFAVPRGPFGADSTRADEDVSLRSSGTRYTIAGKRRLSANACLRLNIRWRAAKDDTGSAMEG